MPTARDLLVLRHLGEVLHRRDRDPSRTRSQSADGRSASFARIGGSSSLPVRERGPGSSRTGDRRQVRQPDALAELREEPVVRRGDHQLAVGRREHLVGCDQRERGAEPTRCVAGAKVAVS